MEYAVLKLEKILRVVRTADDAAAVLAQGRAVAKVAHLDRQFEKVVRDYEDGASAILEMAGSSGALDDPDQWPKDVLIYAGYVVQLIAHARRTIDEGDAAFSATYGLHLGELLSELRIVKEYERTVEWAQKFAGGKKPSADVAAARRLLDALVERDPDKKSSQLLSELRRRELVEVRVEKGAKAQDAKIIFKGLDVVWSRGTFLQEVYEAKKRFRNRVKTESSD